MKSEVLLVFLKHAFLKRKQTKNKKKPNFENQFFRHFSMTSCGFCEKQMQVYIKLTPYMLFRNLN